MKRSWPKAAASALFLIAASADTARAQAIDAGTFSDWTLHTTGEGAGKVCYAATLASDLGDGPAQRGDRILYISAWPKDGIKSEISIKLGSAAKAAAGAKVMVGKDTFSLFIKDDRAFVADATQELKLVDAMKKGSKLTVDSTAAGGTTVTDTYSLSGITQALQALAAACP